jgi:hypothetical protein
MLDASVKPPLFFDGEKERKDGRGWFAIKESGFSALNAFGSPFIGNNPRGRGLIFRYRKDCVLDEAIGVWTAFVYAETGLYLPRERKLEATSGIHLPVKFNFTASFATVDPYFYDRSFDSHGGGNFLETTVRPMKVRLALHPCSGAPWGRLRRCAVTLVPLLPCRVQMSC